MICLGIEGTAEKTGVGIVDSKGNILSSVGKQMFPEEGGIHPRIAAEHHLKWIPQLIPDALKKANIDYKDIDLISFSQGPGLGPALRAVATSARTLSISLKIPLVGVNHCIAHIEIGKLDTGAINPLTLYASGGNTQVISYESGRYRIFGETLDIAIGNCLDQFSRDVGLTHPGGPIVEKLAKKGSYFDLPYTVKGMDFSFSGILSAALRMHNKGIAIEDICYSLQETAFSMLVEVTERALSHTQKDEVMLCGGVAANKRLREMLSIMAYEHGANFYIPEMKYCGDNGAMIAWLGILTFNSFGNLNIEDSEIIQKFRTDEVDAPWVENNNKSIELPDNLIAKGAESNILKNNYFEREAISKVRISKSYRIKEIDEKIIKSRTKTEAKLISDIKKGGVLTPILYDVDLNEKTILMEKINGDLVKDVISNDNSSILAQIIGENIANFHKLDIIHGDITTSNMILNDNDKIVFIDLGLGKYSDLIEDKASDLLVLKNSLQTIDYKIASNTFNTVIDSYANSYSNQNSFKRKISKKLEEIESRARYAH